MKKEIPILFLNKKIHLIGLCIIFSALLYAQQGKDVLYLKNGSIIKGTITNQDSSVRIQTKDGSAFVYSHTDIDTMILFSTARKNLKSDRNRLWVGWFGEPQMQGTTMSRKEKNFYSSSYLNPNGLVFPLSGGFASGLSVSYEAPQTIGFETGLTYHLYQAQAKPRIYTGANEQTSHFSSSSLEIPIYLLLHSNGAKVRFYTTVGFSGGIVLAGQFHFHNTDGNGTVSDGTDHLHVDSATSLFCTVNVKTGVELEISSHLLLKVGASFTASSTSTLGQYNFYYYPYYQYQYVNVPYSVGLNVALLIKTPCFEKRKKTG